MRPLLRVIVRIIDVLGSEAPYYLGFVALNAALLYIDPKCSCDPFSALLLSVYFGTPFYIFLRGLIELARGGRDEGR